MIEYRTTRFNIITFRQFLKEANFGSLEKDIRIFDIFDLLIKDMKTTIKARQGIKALIRSLVTSDRGFTGTVKTELQLKHKKTNIADVKIRWEISPILTKNKTRQIRDVIFRIPPDNIPTLVFEFYILDSESDKEFKNNLLAYINDDIKYSIFHEIKHLLDYLDGIYDESHIDKYISPKQLNAKDFAKYYFQDQEINNFLIDIITELKSIKQSNPDISFDSALQKSDWYIELKDKFESSNINQSKFNKLKAKLAYFWSSTYRR